MLWRKKAICGETRTLDQRCLGVEQEACNFSLVSLTRPLAIRFIRGGITFAPIDFDSLGAAHGFLILVSLK